MSKIKNVLITISLFFFFFIFSSTNVKAVNDSTIINSTYETYIMKYDYCSHYQYNNSPTYCYKDITYSLAIDNYEGSIDSVSYEMWIENISSSTISVKSGEYAIIDGVLHEPASYVATDIPVNGQHTLYITNYDIGTIEDMLLSINDIDFFEESMSIFNDFYGYLAFDTAGPIRTIRQIENYDIQMPDNYPYTYTNGSNHYKRYYDVRNLIDYDSWTDYTLSNESVVCLSDLHTVIEVNDRYQEGYNDGYLVGYSEGESDVDITSDNDTAIDIYISQNNYHTDLEFNMNYTLGYNDGIRYVYETLDENATITEYVKEYIENNNYYTEKEYVDNYEDGIKYVYRNIDKDPIIKEYVENKIKEIKIEFENVSGDSSTKLIKKYDVDITDTGDTKITIHYGQDNYNIETETIVEVVPGENQGNDIENVDYSKTENIVSILVAAVCILLFVVGFVVFLSLISNGSKKVTFKKGGNKYVYR